MSEGIEETPTETAAVQSTTEAAPAAADQDSAPGPYEGLEPDRPPVSTTKADEPIAHSMVGGAGAPSPPSDEALEAQAPAGDVTLEDPEAAPRKAKPGA